MTNAIVKPVLKWAKETAPPNVEPRSNAFIGEFLLTVGGGNCGTWWAQFNGRELPRTYDTEVEAQLYAERVAHAKFTIGLAILNGDLP